MCIRDRAYVALVRNSKGEVLQKFRGEAPLSATPNQVAALKESHFLYNEHFEMCIRDRLNAERQSEQPGAKLTDKTEKPQAQP